MSISLYYGNPVYRRDIGSPGEGLAEAFRRGGANLKTRARGSVGVDDRRAVTSDIRMRIFRVPARALSRNVLRVDARARANLSFFSAPFSFLRMT